VIRIEWSTDAGALVALEPTPDDIAAHAAELAVGYNEPTNASLMGHTDTIEPAEIVEHYADMLAEGARPFLLFRDGELVGDADLRGLRGGSAEFAFMIGARNVQGKGLGTRFAIMIHAFGFATLELARIYASIVPHNTASRRVFEKLGYEVDDSAAARAYADEPGDVVMRIDRASFEQRHAAALAAIRIA
jgi:RimJ/RimL family protein N-acetyltransferase